MLDKIVSTISFDPIEFLFLNEKEQLDAIKQLVDPLGKVNIIENQINNAYDKRTIEGREVTRLDNNLKSMEYHKEASEKIETETLLKNLQQTHSIHNKFRELTTNTDSSRKRIKDMESQLQAEKANLKKNEDALKSFGVLPDLKDAEERFKSAERNNELVKENEEFNKVKKELKIVTDNYDLMTEQVEKYRKNKETFIKSCKMPIDSLSFGEEALLLNKREFKACSEGEQLEASMKISIAMNTGLRIMSFINASLLDPERRKHALKIAKKENMQVIMEVVTSDKDLIIEFEEETI